ncbi:M16 family metallopeptidase [Grimontia marina]|uniref:Protease 3 n=1 Tax=Grimontia marina TaxID=646534 RepID=A0A128FJC0_9GAMM|nr:M16 family metallopeptidase [Grimontia marina]CZF86404.1 Protease 3 precursor [Grimontia marina]
MLVRYAVALFVLLISGCASFPKSPTLTPDPNWVSATLPNGMRYHLYPIEGEQIELRLIVNVGSLDEEDNERGYAHFIEHMAFNGTRRYPNNSVFEEFAQVGVEFGPDINAVTEYGRTVYQLSLPDHKRLPDALDWFRDISDGMTLDRNEVAGEVGVIFAEWRRDNREDTPWPLKLYDDLIDDSLYIDRDPIGTESTLNRVTAESLKAFYDKWYQANRIQLVVIGGFDVENVKVEIEEEFSSLGTESTLPEPYSILPVDRDTQYPLTLYASQGESPALVVSFKDGEDKYPQTLAEQRDLWLRWMVLDAVQLRLEEQFERENLAHNGLYFNFGFLPGWKVYELSVEFNDIDRPYVLDSVARNIASLRDHGVTLDEFLSLVEQYESRNFFHEDQLPIEVAENVYNDFYYNRLPQSRSEQNDNFNKFLEDIELDDLNRELTRLLKPSNQSLTIVYGKGESIANAEKQRDSYMNTVVNQGEIVKVSYAEVQIPQPEPFVTVTEDAIEMAENIFRWKLPNGMPALYYKMDDSDYETQVVLQAKGGVAAMSTKERAALDLLFETYRNGSVGEVSSNDYSHYLESLGVNIEPQVYGNSHSVSMYVPTEYLLDGLNALRYLVENTTPSEVAFEREKVRLIERINIAQTSPYEVFDRASLNLIYPPPSYESPLTIEDYESVTFEDVTSLFNKLFGDMGYFSVYVVSDEPLLAVQGVVTALLGNLKTTREKTEVKSLIYNQKGGRVVKHLSPEDRTYVEQVFIRSSTPRTVDSVFAEDLLNRVLQTRYNQIVREEYSLSYDPFFSSWTWDGESVVTTTMTALVSPDKEKELESLWPKIRKALTKPVTKTERNNAARQLIKDWYESQTDPQFLVGSIARYDLWGYDLEGLIFPEQVIERIDNKTLSEMASVLFDDAAFFESILRPINAD